MAAASPATGDRLAALRRHGVQLAEGDSPAVRRVPVPVVEHPAGVYDLVTVFVRTHQGPNSSRWPGQMRVYASVGRR